MSVTDAQSWWKRNMWKQPTGDFAVRPGLRRISTLSGTPVAGFTVQNPWTLEQWHYIARLDGSNSLHVDVYDNNFVLWQDFDTGVVGAPVGFSHAVVEGQLLICSPSMPTLYGLVGSGIGFAVKVASTNPSTTALTVPRGIVSSWCNRAVICDGASMFVSDPVAVTGGDLRTFVAQNQNQRPGVVFGIHEGAEGMLVAVTSAGVFGLDSSAAAVGIVGTNATSWSMLNHARANSYDSSCVVKGRVYALTRRGYALVDTPTDEEESLDDPVFPRRFGPRIASNDWRSSRMYGGEDGPLCTSTNLVSYHDLSEQFRSWWTCGVGSSFTLRGILSDDNGADMFLCEDGVYAIGGNYDGDTTSTPAATQATGVLYGRILTNPGQNPTEREVRAAASLGGVGSIDISVRGDTGGVASTTPAVSSRSLVIGTSSWGGTAPNGNTAIYEPAPMAPVRWQGDLNTDEITVEVAVSFPDTRVDAIVVDKLSDSAGNRPGLRGN